MKLPFINQLTQYSSGFANMFIKAEDELPAILPCYLSNKKTTNEKPLKDSFCKNLINAKMMK